MNEKYYVNIMTLTVMWSAASFSNYLLNFMNKYLEGTIFQNNYYEGLAGLMAVVVGASLYKNLGKKKAFIFAFGLALGSGLIIYSFQSQKMALPKAFLAHFKGSEKTQYRLAVHWLIPKITFFAKFGIGLSFLFSYQASFSD